MPKVYAVQPGASIRLGNYGEATESAPVEVPEDVARELAENPDVRVEVEAPAPRLARKPHKEEKEG